MQETIAISAFLFVSIDLKDISSISDFPLF
jgi:hypothetical protein